MEEIVRLIKNNNSIPKISKKLNVSKSTVHHHYKKIKGPKYKKTVIPKEDSILGEFLGVFSGDGGFFLIKKDIIIEYPYIFMQ